MKKNLSFYLTGSILTAITVMLLVGAVTVSSSIYQCFDPYFAKTKIEDGEFVTESEISAGKLRELEKQYDVTIEKQQYLDFSYDDTRLRVFARTDKIDLVTVTVGRNVQAADEILLTWRYAKAHGITVGDTIELAGRQFHVCGLGMKPDYAIMLYELSESVPDKDGFGIGIVTAEAMESLGNGVRYYSVRYGDPTKETAFRTEISEKYGTTEYIEQKANSRIRLIYQEADDLVAEFSLYCPVILVVVIVVIAMVLARMVRREGKTIGTLMALGYRKKELIRHYMLYGMIPAAAGDVLGVILCVPFSKAFCSFYFGDAEYIDYVVKMPWQFIGIVLLIPPVVYGLVSYLVLCGVLNVQILPLLKGIRKGKTLRLLNGSNAALPLIYNIRAVIINGFRSLTFLVGVAVATLCIILGGSFQDAYDDLLEEKVPYAMLGGQYEYGFHSYQTDNPYGGNAIFDVSFGAKADDSRFNLIGYEKENDFTDLKTTDGKALNSGDYYMTSAAARQYGIQAGDMFSFYNTVTMQEHSVRISGIVKNDILTLVLTGKENAAELLGRPAEEYNVIISKDKLDIPANLLKKAASLEDYRNMVKNLSATAGIVLKLLKVLGVLIAVLIVTMISGMIAEESSRNISMLKVLGYRDREVQKFVFTSNHLLVPAGFILGVPFGYLTAYAMICAMAKSSGMFMSLPVKADTLLYSFVFVALAYFVALAVSGRKCRKVEMTESLRSMSE